MKASRAFKGFDPTLSKRHLISPKGRWLASDGGDVSAIPEEVDPLTFKEGAKKRFPRKNGHGLRGSVRIK